VVEWLKLGSRRHEKGERTLGQKRTGSPKTVPRSRDQGKDKKIHDVQKKEN